MGPFGVGIWGPMALQGLTSLFQGRQAKGAHEDTLEHENRLQEQRLGTDLGQHNWMYGSNLSLPGQPAMGIYPNRGDEDFYGLREEDEEDDESYYARTVGRY